MCYHPVDIINPSKYVSLRYRDKYLMQVPCGKCAACRTAKSNEWTYRLYHHALETFRSGDNSFVLFDTLTYNNESLPHISDYLHVSPEVDFPCFSSRDIRLFVATLRQHCKRYYNNSNFSYFITSEYGTSENHLHRPHYHALFFVTGSITPYQFSQEIAFTWNRGRTDGLPYKSAEHVEENTFRSLSPGAIRSLKYVCKYIQKSCTFQKNIDARLDSIMSDIVSKFNAQGLEEWQNSSHYWRIRESISRKINQFHRQSTFLGYSALSEMDIVELMKSGAVTMPDNISVVKSIPLPTYYKRKLFYELVEIDGSLTWQPTELGYQYLDAMEKKQSVELTRKFDALKLHLKIDYDSSKLVDYLFKSRGRINASTPSKYYERLQDISYFNYVNRYDKESLGYTGLVRQWCGNSSLGYKRKKVPRISISDFISENVILDSDCESVLTQIFDYRKKVDAGKQRLYEEKQRLSNLYHHYFP